MARTRFGTSQLTETLSGLLILLSPDVRPWHRDWQRRTCRRAGRPTGRRRGGRGAGEGTPSARPGRRTSSPCRRRHPISTSTRRCSTSSRWTTPGYAPTSSSSPGRSHRSSPPPGSRVRRRPAPLGVAANDPRRVGAPAPDPAGRRGSRTARSSREGWSGALDGIAPGVRWLENGRLQVNAHPYPPRDIRGAHLLLIAAHSRGSWVSWRLPDLYAVVYPVTGCSLDTRSPVRAPGPPAGA